MSNNIYKGTFEDHQGNILYPRTDIDQVNNLEDTLERISDDIKSIEQSGSSSVGNLDNLNTKNKTTIVDAINEVNSKEVSGGVTSINGESGDIELDAYNLPLNSNSPGWTINDELGRRAFSIDVGSPRDLQTESKENLVEAINEILRLSGEGSSKYVVPRVTLDPVDGEIYVKSISTESKCETKIVRSDEGITHDGDNQFTFEGGGDYNTLEIEIEGEGSITMNFHNVEGYYSYTVYKMTEDGDISSGWVKDDQVYTHEVSDGDRVMINSSSSIKLSLSTSATATESSASLYFGDTPIMYDDSIMKAKIMGKAERKHSHSIRDIEDIGNISAGVKIYTQRDQPKSMKVGDQWHRIVSV